MSCYYNGGNAPRGRSGKVYLVLAIIALVLGAINETLGALFLIVSCYLAWVTSLKMMSIIDNSLEGMEHEMFFEK